MFHRVRDIIYKIKRQIQAVLELDFFASSSQNDKVIIASLELLVRGMRKDHARLVLLEQEVAHLREILNNSKTTASQQGSE